MSNNANCLNCNNELLTGAKYCAACGQKANTHRLNLSFVLHEVTHFFTHADKGIFYLVKMLAINPGKVIRGYVQGQRKKYFSPFNFFLISVGLFVFVTATFKPMASGSNTAAHRVQVIKIPDETTRSRQLKKLDRIDNAVNFVGKYSNIIRFIATPFFALFFFIFYRKSGINFTEFLVAAFYLSGFTALIFAFIITPYLVQVSGKAYLAGISAYLLFEMIYWSVGIYYFINKRSVRKYLYALMVSFLMTLFWVILTRFLMAYYINGGFG